MKALTIQMRIYYSLYDRLLDRRAMARAFEKVRRAQGAPGVDRQTIADFQSRLWEELDQLVTELRTRTYQPHPVRRVSIPKPDGGERHLGIPAVRDRVVQQLLLDILQPIFDPPPRKLKAVTRQVMVIVRAAAANRQWRKQRCSFASMAESMWLIWIFRNALTAWIMT